jgi:hypothetical protein
MTSKNDVLIKGTYVRYKIHTGIINFVCNRYVTLIIKKGDHRSNDVEILIYPDNFKFIELIESK